MDRYTKEKGIHDPYEDSFSLEDLYKIESEPSIFHIGQSYEAFPAKKLACKSCGGDEFNVGGASYYTAIRCTKCEWEDCIHDG